MSEMYDLSGEHAPVFDLAMWLRCYYPVTAQDCARDGMFIRWLGHSVLKWTGLSAGILAAYGLVQHGCVVVERLNGNNGIRVDESTCAFCVAAQARCDDAEYAAVECGDLLDRCDYCVAAENAGRTCEDAYDQWHANGDTLPMLIWLSYASKVKEQK